METITTRVEERDSRLTRRESILRDFVRFSWRAIRGLTTAAEAEGRELVHQMTELGRITEAEEQRLLKELLGRMTESRHQFERRVDSSVRGAIQRINEISTKELISLQDRVTQAERRVTELWNRKHTN